MTPRSFEGESDPNQRERGREGCVLKSVARHYKRMGRFIREVEHAFHSYKKKVSDNGSTELPLLELNFLNCRILGADIQEMSSRIIDEFLLSETPALHLAFPCCQFYDAEALEALKTFLSSHDVRSLSFSATNFEQGEIVELVAAAKHTVKSLHLTIRYTGGLEDQIDQVCPPQPEHHDEEKKLDEHQMKQQESQQSNVAAFPLEELKLDARHPTQSRIRIPRMRELADVLPRLQHRLKSFELTSCEFEDEGFSILAGGLLSLRDSLEHVHIQMLKSEISPSSLMFMSYLMNDLPHLTYFNLSLQNSRRKLFAGATAQQVDDFVEAAKKCRAGLRLEFYNVGMTRNTSIKFLEVAASTNSSNFSLLLEDSNFITNGDLAQELIKILPETTKCTELSIIDTTANSGTWFNLGNWWNEETEAAMLQAMEQNKSLEHFTFRLAEQDFTKESQQRIRSILQRNTDIGRMEQIIYNNTKNSSTTSLGLWPLAMSHVGASSEGGCSPIFLAMRHAVKQILDAERSFVETEENHKEEPAIAEPLDVELKAPQKLSDMMDNDTENTEEETESSDLTVEYIPLHDPYDLSQDHEHSYEPKVLETLHEEEEEEEEEPIEQNSESKPQENDTHVDRLVSVDETKGLDSREEISHAVDQDADVEQPWKIVINEQSSERHSERHVGDPEPIVGVEKSDNVFRDMVPKEGGDVSSDRQQLPEQHELDIRRPVPQRRMSDEYVQRQRRIEQAINSMDTDSSEGSGWDTSSFSGSEDGDWDNEEILSSPDADAMPQLMPYTAAAKDEGDWDNDAILASADVDGMPKLIPFAVAAELEPDRSASAPNSPEEKPEDTKETETETAPTPIIVEEKKKKRVEGEAEHKSIKNESKKKKKSKKKTKDEPAKKKTKSKKKKSSMSKTKITETVILDEPEDCPRMDDSGLNSSVSSNFVPDGPPKRSDDSSKAFTVTHASTEKTVSENKKSTGSSFMDTLIAEMNSGKHRPSQRQGRRPKRSDDASKLFVAVNEGDGVDETRPKASSKQKKSKSKKETKGVDEAGEFESIERRIGRSSLSSRKKSHSGRKTRSSSSDPRLERTTGVTSKTSSKGKRSESTSRTISRSDVDVRASVSSSSNGRKITKKKKKDPSTSEVGQTDNNTNPVVAQSSEKTSETKSNEQSKLSVSKGGVVKKESRSLENKASSGKKKKDVRGEKGDTSKVVRKDSGEKTSENNSIEQSNLPVPHDAVATADSKRLVKKASSSSNEKSKTRKVKSTDKVQPVSSKTGSSKERDTLTKTTSTKEKTELNGENRINNKTEDNIKSSVIAKRSSSNIEEEAVTTSAENGETSDVKTKTRRKSTSATKQKKSTKVVKESKTGKQQLKTAKSSMSDSQEETPVEKPIEANTTLEYKKSLSEPSLGNEMAHSGLGRTESGDGAPKKGLVVNDVEDQGKKKRGLFTAWRR